MCVCVCLFYTDSVFIYTKHHMPLAIWMCQMTEKHIVHIFDKWITWFFDFTLEMFPLFSIFYWEKISFTIAANVTHHFKWNCKSGISIVAFQLFEKGKLEIKHKHTQSHCFSLFCIFQLNVYLYWIFHWNTATEVLLFALEITMKRNKTKK